MQRTLHPPISFRPDPDGPATFNVVIVYEDFQSGKHGINTYNHLVKHLGKQCEVSNQMWKFDILVIPSLRELACRDAEDADIIIISCRGTNALPESVTSWLESWSHKPGHALALVALFDNPETQQAQGARDFLSRVARKTGLEFFAQPDAWPGSAEPVMPEDVAFTRETGRSADLLPPRWGINE